jgi:hypothetical protein
MRAFTRLGYVAATLVLAGILAPVLAQEKPRASPHETAQATVDGASISITYGRPYMKGRKIMGGLVPFDKIWRTGADEATTLVTDRALTFGSLVVPAGTYTIYTLPGPTTWQIVINKQTGQWGTEYQQAQDLGRIPVTPTSLATPVEQFTIKIDDTAAGGTLVLEWEQTSVAAPFAVEKK